MHLRTKLNTVVAQLAHLPQTFRLIWAAARGWTVAWGTLLVLQGIIPVALVYLTKLLVDSLVVAIGAHGSWVYIRPALVLIIITAGVTILSESLDSASEWVRTAQAELVQDYIKQLVHGQSAAVDLAFYESPEFYDGLEQARGEASSKPLALLESFGALLQNGITLVAMGFLLISYSVWLPLALLISTLPAFYVVFRFDRIYHRWWQQSTAQRRWIQYYDIMLTHSAAAAEVRVFGLGKHFQTLYQKIRRQLRTERLHQMRNQTLARLGAGAAALVVSGVIILWMGWRAVHGLATLGDLALFYQAFNRGQSVVRTLLGSAGKIYTNSLFVGNLFKFLALKPEILDPAEPRSCPDPLQKGIEFQNVTFRYPGSKTPALENFDLSLPAGKIIAIVGANGAGKTTLFKLLCRFYDPESGSIKLDGIDIRDLALKDLWRLYSVLLQQPLNYHATVAESIAMSDLQLSASPEQVEAAARNAGAHEFISRLPKGYETLLGKWFADGSELSGGEWQRVAMARAYLRKSPVILLDEPTSFLDSWSEADWFARFRSLCQGRTALVITHRFTVAMRADIIHVMDKGRIVESGSHHELVSSNGLYAESWIAQMESSTDNSETAGEGTRPAVGIASPAEQRELDVATVIQ
jgi:ATP-binding cassette subfamily B protein